MKIIPKIKLLVKRTLNYKVPGKYIKIKESDIFLVSYPKSGNTWLRFLFGNALYPEGVDFKNINELIPDIYLSYKNQIDKLKAPRIIKSHEPFSSQYPKVIYIYRDPRDVVVSYYYWYKKFQKNKYLDFNNFFDAFIKGNVSFGLWSNHIKGWMEAANKNPDKIFVAKYEDLKLDTFKYFKKMLNFCNIYANDKDIHTSVEKSSFNSMKKLEEDQEKQSFLKHTDLNIKFVRSGKSEWRQVLSNKQIETINNTFKDYLYEFDSGSDKTFD